MKFIFPFFSVGRCPLRGTPPTHQDMPPGTPPTRFGRETKPASRNLKKILIIGFKDLFYPFSTLLTALPALKTLFGPVLSIFSTFIERKSLLTVQKGDLGARRAVKIVENGWGGFFSNFGWPAWSSDRNG